MSKMKSFRGLIADGGQISIPLRTNNGSMGYMIKKFELFPDTPGQDNSESVVQIFSVEQSTPSTTAVTVDFSDQTLLAAAFYGAASSTDYPQKTIVVFDNMIFNQDVFVTHTNTAGLRAVNYYIELEQVKLDLTENTIATLKDIRNIEAQ
jgi:hypothetical protein